MPTSISQDNFGNYWIGLGTKGIYKIVNNSVQKITTNTKLDKTPTRNIFHSKTGATWFGTEKGLVLFREGNYVEFENEDSINKIIEDRERNIWVGTDSGGLKKLAWGF